MGDISQKAGNYGAEREFNLRQFFEGFHFPEYPAETYRRKRDGIVQKELGGVDYPGVLNGLQNAVYQPASTPFLVPNI